MRIDRLLVQFGMPMGPFTLLDEVGLDIGAHVARSLFEGYGARMTPTDALDAIISPERLGKKTGRGFYHHPKGKKGKPVIMDDLSQFQRGTRAMSMSDLQITERIVLAMIAEGARAFEERVVGSAQEFDLATVFGTGFAPFRGGLLRFADTLGASRVVDMLERHGSMVDVADRGEARLRFAAADVLMEQARTGSTFH